MFRSLTRSWQSLRERQALDLLDVIPEPEPADHASVGSR